MTLRRCWDDARAKVQFEGECRHCGSTQNLEAAHVLGRTHDVHPPLDWDESKGAWGWRRPIIVWPSRVLPLCRACHRRAHDHGDIDFLPLLTLDEQLQAVADAGGIEQARVRLIPRPIREAPMDTAESVQADAA